MAWMNTQGFLFEPSAGKCEGAPPYTGVASVEPDFKPIPQTIISPVRSFENIIASGHTIYNISGRLVEDKNPSPGAYSGSNRPLIPIQFGHPFRFISATESGSLRPPYPGG